jgi:hypothetical protein
MQAFRASITLFALLVIPADAANPIRKVITLMQEMTKEIEAEKEKEKALYEKFMCICSEYPSELTATIEESTKKISELTSSIEEETASKTELEGAVKGHAADKAAAEKDLEKATMLREKEEEEYESTIASTESSIKGLAGAIASLEKGATAASLMQAPDANRLKAMIETSPMISTFSKDRVIAFLGGQDSETTGGSGEILGILKQMHDDMQKTLSDAQAAEEVAKTGYSDLKAAKDQEIETAAETIESKEKRAGELEVSIAQSKDALEDTSGEKADAEKMLATLTSTCGSRKKEFEARLKIRDDEIAAISQAITILNDDDALDVFKKAVPSALVDADGDDSQSAGFLQTRRLSISATRLEKAVEIVGKAKHPNPQMGLLLQTIKAQLSAAKKATGKGSQAPDFSVVTKMIDDMVGVLNAETVADTKKKAWCTDELLKAEKSQAKAQEKTDANAAEISQVQDEIDGFTEDVAALEKDVTDIDKEVALAPEQRKKEHSEYTETLQMTEAAIALIGKAKNRLQKFYNPTLYKAPPKTEKTMEEKIIDSYSFIQRHAFGNNAKKQLPDLPEVPKYEKQNSGGIIHLMDTITKDLEMDMSEAGYAEKTAQKEYVELMAEQQALRAQAMKSLVEKKGSKAELESRMVKAKKSQKEIFEELNNAYTLVQEIHASCDEIVENFANRMAAREQELESLKSAKAVISGAK